MNRSPSILVIDDEPALRVGLAALIKRRGYQVITATDGNDGLKKAKEQHPDLILSDVMMPPPNGFEMRRIMEQDPQLATIPFIFLTARTDTVDRITGIRDGADDYVTKPYVPDELLARIEAVLRRVEREQARGREQMMVVAQENMERLKREILQNFHHELQTPLVNITMPLQMAVTQKFDSPEEQVKFIQMALSNVNRLETLVMDFAMLTNIDQHNLNNIRQSIDVNNHILLPVRKRLERYSFNEIEFTQDVTLQSGILAPRREFTHAIVHLADNAFKFSSPHGKVRLTVESSSNGGATITVQDSGPGIPVDQRQKVFERFYQISQGGDRQYEGLGVGLYIARAIFENLGGTVSILDVPAGCCVQAVLPDCRPEDIVYA